MGVFFAVLLVVSLLLEASITTLPLVLVSLLLLAIFYRQTFVFSVGFVSGLVLDILTLRPIGQTSVVFILFLLFIKLYERKFEVQTVPFTLFASALGTILYCLIFRVTQLLLEVIVATVLAFVLFVLLQFAKKRFTKRKRLYI